MSMFDSSLPSVTVLCDVPFPATLISGPGIQVLTADPTAWEMSLDYDPLPEDDLLVTPLTQYYMAVEDATQSPEIYAKIRLDRFANSIVNIDQRTPIGDISYTVQISDRYVGLTAPLTIPRVITLPPAATVAPGRQITLQDECGGLSGTAYWTVLASGADLIDGKNVLYIARRYAGYRLTCDGASNWSLAAPTGMAIVSAVPGYAVLPDDTTVGVGVILGPTVTITLPPCQLCTPGKTITVLDLGGQCSAVSTIAVVPQTGELINGVPAPIQATLNAAYSYITLQSDGSGRWTVTAGGTNPSTETILSSQISDSTTIGRNVLTATSTNNAQTAIGASPTGQTVFTAPTANAALGALGGTTVGIGVFTAPGQTSAQSALGLGTMAVQSAINVGIIGGSIASTQLNNNTIVGGSIDNTQIGATTPANATFANCTILGVATATTAPPGTSNTNIATTAFVGAAIAAIPAPVVPQGSNTTPFMSSGPGVPGVAATFSRGDHVHPTDTSRAAASALASYLPLAGGTMAGQLTLGNAGRSLVSPGYGDFFTNAQHSFSPTNAIINMGVYSAIPSGGAIAARVDNTTTYLVGFSAGGNFVGSITTDGNSTHYGTSSDQRLKKNIRVITDDLDPGEVIDRLQVRAWEWKQKVNGKQVTGYGFVAQELHEVVEHAVVVGIDDVEENEMGGRPWQSDAAQLVPYLVAELQLLRQRVAQLEGG